MGFFKTIRKSFQKSDDVRRLQKQIHPSDEMEGVIANLRQRLQTDSSPQDAALEEYLDLCEADDGVRSVMAKYSLSRSDLKDISSQLTAGGLGQWVKGHYAALSTIAYVEPLQYYVHSKHNGVGTLELHFNLLQYWRGEIPQRGLLARIQP